MKLVVYKRAAKKRSDITKVRLEGKVPAVLYGGQGEGSAVCVKEDELAALLRKVPSQLLATTVFELEEEGSVVKAVVKEVQYHPVTYKILHLDFQRIDENRPLSVNIPIQLQNVADCAGVKLGGFVRQVIRSLKVECLLKDLPRQFDLDILNLGISQVLRLSDISIPSGVKPVAKMNEVAVVIAKKA